MQFYIRTFLETELVGYQELDDPFVVHIIKISWLDRVKSLFKKELELTVRLDGDPEAIRNVMALTRHGAPKEWFTHVPGGESAQERY